MHTHTEYKNRYFNESVPIHANSTRKSIIFRQELLRKNVATMKCYNNRAKAKHIYIKLNNITLNTVYIDSIWNSRWADWDEPHIHMNTDVYTIIKIIISDRLPMMSNHVTIFSSFFFYCNEYLFVVVVWRQYRMQCFDAQQKYDHVYHPSSSLYSVLNCSRIEKKAGNRYISILTTSKFDLKKWLYTPCWHPQGETIFFVCWYVHFSYGFFSLWTIWMYRYTDKRIFLKTYGNTYIYILQSSHFSLYTYTLFFVVIVRLFDKPGFISSFVGFSAFSSSMQCALFGFRET